MTREDRCSYRWKRLERKSTRRRLRPLFRGEVKVQALYFFETFQRLAMLASSYRGELIVKLAMSHLQSGLPLSLPSDPEAESSRIDIPAYVDNWDEYFLNIAKAVSIKSKDPKCLSL